MFFVDQRLKVSPKRPANVKEFLALPIAEVIKVRGALLKNLGLIQTFVDENPDGLSPDELDIVLSWRHLVHGDFVVLRYLKNYAVFLSAEKPSIAYGVLAPTQPLDEVIGPYLPVMVQGVLVPFKNQIVYDGLLSTYGVTFGPGARRGFNEDFKEAKTSRGIVTSLPMSDTPMPPKPPKAKTAAKPASRHESAELVGAILGMVDRFCLENLNEEYAILCRALAEKLARKRPSPLLSGKPNAWAGGIVRTIGWVNFLSDPSQTPHMRLRDIDAAFGVGESTGTAKSSVFRKMFNIHHFDPNWCLPSKLADNPLVWMLQVNGIMMDVRRAPREVQEIAFEKGLIPYIPPDR